MKFPMSLFVACLAGSCRAVNKAAILSYTRNAAVAGFESSRVAVGQMNIQGHMTQTGGQAVQWVVQNPGTTAAYAAAGVGVVAVAAPGLIAAPVLGVAGFGAKGVVLASGAAKYQGAYLGGNIVAQSVFATLQSAGAAGAGVANVNAAVQVGGVGVTLASGGVAWLKSKL